VQAGNTEIASVDLGFGFGVKVNAGLLKQPEVMSLAVSKISADYSP